MFHYSNLGVFGGGLRQYADRNGFVPQAGDNEGDFNFEDCPNASLDFEDRICEAAIELKEAKKALRDWQKNNG